MIEILIANKTYKELNKEMHHGVTRMEHCVKVMEKAMELYGKLDSEIMKAALLHDFFFNNQVSKIKQHPIISVKNSREQGFNINNEVEHMILSHMWPVAGPMPRTYKAWCVNVADKFVSIKEFLNLTLW